MITEREALVAAGFKDVGNGRMKHPRLRGRAMLDHAAHARWAAAQSRQESGSDHEQENRE